MESNRTLCNLLALLALLTIAAFAWPGFAAEDPSASSEEAGIAGEIIETENGIYYTVKDGDTLWDLSRKFSNSEYFWPDLWSGNPQIPNPHRIYPGERIRLYRRSDFVSSGTGADSDATAGEESTAATDAESDEDAHQPKMPFVYAGIDQVGFIREVPVESHGRIFKTAKNHKMIATDDVVYIEKKGGHDLVTGMRYTVFRVLGPIHHVHSEDFIGYQHYLLGVLEITRSNPDYAIGKIVKAYGRMKVDDLLMPYERRSPEFDRIAPPEGLTGEVIMAEEHNQLIGDHTVAFIDKGADDGVRQGQSFNIFSQEKQKITPAADKPTLLDAVVFGEMMVLHAEATTATVYITRSESNISPGSTFRTPVQQTLTLSSN